MKSFEPSTSNALRLRGQRGGEELQYGVMTAWLLSTLGGTRNNNTVNVRKKDILSLSITKTCNLLKDPSLDLPLKYMSNLLLGVTLCYSRKTDFILADIAHLQSQLQKHLMGLSNQRKSRTDRKGLVTTIFDGVDEYQNIIELQREMCLRNETNSMNNHYLTDDPLFNINDMRDTSFLNHQKVGSANSSSLIKQRDILMELSNGYNGDDDTQHYLSQVNRNYSRSNPDFDGTSGLDFDLNLDFGDVMSDFGTRSSSSTERQTGEIDRTEDRFELDFNPLYAESDFIERSDFEDTNDNQRGGSNASKRTYDQETETSKNKVILQETGFKKQIKRRRLNKNFSTIMSDDKTTLSTELLRKHNDEYCNFMTAEKDAKSDTQISKAPFDGFFKSLVPFENSPIFLNDCFQFLFANTKALDYLAARETTRLIERGRQNIVSLPPSRSSSLTSTEQGRRVDLIDTRRASVESENASTVLPDLNQIDEELGLGEDAVFEGEENIMHMDLNLPPSSFGRTVSKTASSSRDYVDELQRAGWKQRKSYERSSDNLDDVYEEINSINTGILPTNLHECRSILDERSRKFYDYIELRAASVPQNTGHRSSLMRQLYFEDIIPSRLSSDHLSHEEVGSTSNVINKRIAANAFLTVLQLASKSYIDLEACGVENPLDLMGGSNIIIYI